MITVLITGAAGLLGSKARRALAPHASLRLLDRDPRGDEQIVKCDLALWDLRWVDLLEGVDVVVHLAGNPDPGATWSQLVGPNVDACISLFAAAARQGVRRVVFASSNHVMGGYRDAKRRPPLLRTDTPVRPGVRSTTPPLDTTAYAATKLWGERLGYGYVKAGLLSAICLRIGWVHTGENSAAQARVADPWFRDMWLSDGDFGRLIVAAVRAPADVRFAIVNGVSRNSGSPWDVTSGTVIDFAPLDDVLAEGT